MKITLNNLVFGFIMVIIAMLFVNFYEQTAKESKTQSRIIKSIVISDLRAEYGTNIIVFDAPDRIEISFTYGKHKEVYIFTEKDYGKLYEP